MIIAIKEVLLFHQGNVSHPSTFILYFYFLLSYSPIPYTTNYSLHWSHCWFPRLQQDLCPWFRKCCRRSRSLTQACASGLMYKISSSSKKTVYLTCFTWTKCSRICITSDTYRHQSKRDAGTIFLAKPNYLPPPLISPFERALSPY